MEPAVGTLRPAFARKHARWVFPVALNRKHPGGKRELAGHVLGQQPPQNIAPVVVFRQADFRDFQVRQRLEIQRLPNYFIADFKLVELRRVPFLHGGPLLQQSATIGVEPGFEVGVEVLKIVFQRIVADQFYCSVDLVQLPREGRLIVHKLIVASAFFDDFGQIPHPVGGDNGRFGGCIHVAAVRHGPGLTTYRCH